MPLILGTNSIKDTGYDVANSVRLNDGSSDYLNRTPSSATNQKTFTISMWVKRGELGSTNGLLLQGVNTGNDDFAIYFESVDTINIFSWSSSSEQFTLSTNRKFRDPSAWFHIVLAVDTTQATSSNRIKLYVNGVQETSFSTANYPSLNADLEYNDTSALWVGRSYNGHYFDGYIAEVVSVDGTALAPTSFGEFDEDSGIWKPIDVSGLTFGTNGFYLDFENSGSLGADVSGNGNNFTVNNLTAIDQSTDTCTNNFATLNPLAKGANVTLTEGNLQFTSNNRYGTVGTFGLSSGKWYWEVKVVDAGSDIQVGIFQGGGNIGYPNAELGKTSQGWSVISIGGNRLHNLSQSSYGGAAFSDGDILMVALDMDNGKWYMGKNNSWFDSGNPATSSSPAHTGITGTIFPAIATYAESESGSINYQFNFGSPPYAISSGNTDGNSYGNFEYAVPSGYYALNTKNLAEYG